MASVGVSSQSELLVASQQAGAASVAADHERARDQVYADDVKFGADLALAFGVEIIMGGTGYSTIAHAFGQQGDRLPHDQVADRLGAAPGTLAIGYDGADPALRTFHDLHSVATLGRGVLADSWPPPLWTSYCALMDRSFSTYRSTSTPRISLMLTS